MSTQLLLLLQLIVRKLQLLHKHLRHVPIRVDSKLSINNTGTITQYYKVEYAVNNGGYEYMTTVSVAAGQVDNSIYKNLTSGQYITWRYAATTIQNDFSNASYRYLTRTQTVDCTSANLTATQNTSCDVSGSTAVKKSTFTISNTCLLYTSPSPRDRTRSRMPSSA